LYLSQNAPHPVLLLKHTVSVEELVDFDIDGLVCLLEVPFDGDEVQQL
jgi:hypothetical protein